MGRSAGRRVGRSVGRRVDRSVGLRPGSVVVVASRPVGRPVPFGPGVLLTSPWRRVARGPEAFMPVITSAETILRDRCSPRGSSTEGGGWVHEETVFYGPVGPGSTPHRLGGSRDALFSSSSVGA